MKALYPDTLVTVSTVGRQNRMTPSVNDLLDPSVCSCFPGLYHYTICNKIKWSTLSIGTALLIIVSKFKINIKLFLYYI
jgi:hypothetical protein